MMSSFKHLSAANIYNGHSVGAGQHTYTVGQGIGSIGSVTISTDEIKAITNPHVLPACLSLTVKQGEPTVAFQELQGDGVTLKAVLEPDNTMSSSDLAKIMSLIMVSKESSSHLGGQLKPIAYIRKHNLERHFRFSAE